MATKKGVLRGEEVSIYTLLRAPTSSHFFVINLLLQIFILILQFLAFYDSSFSNFCRLTPNHKWIAPLASKNHLECKGYPPTPFFLH